MTDFEQRIGPRESPSPEPRPLYTHMTWTRPGYKSPPPKKARTQYQPLERTSPYRSRPDTEPSLLLRMDVGALYPSKSVRTDPSPPKRRSPAKLPLSERIGPETREDTGTHMLTLGNHRVEPLLDRDFTPRRSSLSMGDTATSTSSENMCVWSSEQQEKRMSSFSRHSPRVKPQLHYPRSHSPNHSSSHPPDGLETMSPSSATGVGRNFISYSSRTESDLISQHLETLSHLPLKDRLAPLVLQNANLRLDYEHYDQHEANYRQGKPSFSEKSVDNALPPDVCKSVFSSLISAAMQLEEMGPPPCLVHNTNGPTHTKLTEETACPPVFSNGALPSSVSDSVPGQAMSSLPLRLPAHPTPNSPPLTPQAVTHQINRRTLSAKTSVISTNQISPRSYQSSSTAPSRYAIPIPTSAAFFNNGPFVQTPGTSHPLLNKTSQERARRLGERTGSPWKPSSSPNERPYKRPRSRSPPVSSSHGYYKKNDKRRGTDASSSSPPPRIGCSPPTSPSYTRRQQFSPREPRRSRSPPPLRPPSPRRSQSPRRRELTYSSSGRRHPTSAHRGSSPTYSSSRLRLAHEYSYSHHTPNEKLDTNFTPTLSQPMLEGYSRSRTTGEPHRPISQHEQYQERSIRGDEKDKSTQRRQDSTPERRSAQQHSSLNGQMTTNKPTTEHPTATEVRRSPITLPTPPASATYDADHGMEQDGTADMGNSTKLTLENLPTNASDSLQGTKEALSANVGFGAKLDTSAHRCIDDLPEKEEAWQPFNNIPGLWLLNEGSGEADVFEHSFEVTKKMALKWHLPLLEDFINPELQKETRLKFVRKSLPTASWKLKCVPVEAVNVARQTLERPDDTNDLVRQLVQFQSHWPSEGKLLVEVNPGHDIGKTFFPKQLGVGVPFVELNHYVHEGLNTIRFIQLEDISKHVFVLYATPSTNLLLEQRASQKEGSWSGDEFSLENLQHMLQKFRDDKGLALHEMMPLYVTPTAGVSISFSKKKEGETKIT